MKNGIGSCPLFLLALAVPGPTGEAVRLAFSGGPAAPRLLEGLFDRQMDDGRVGEAARYALRERLKHWYGQAETARDEVLGGTNGEPNQTFRLANQPVLAGTLILASVARLLGEDEFTAMFHQGERDNIQARAETGNAEEALVFLLRPGE